MVSIVEGELAGSGRLQAYRWLHLRAIQRGHVVSQETMRMIIKMRSGTPAHSCLHRTRTTSSPTY